MTTKTTSNTSKMDSSASTTLVDTAEMVRIEEAADRYSLATISVLPKFAQAMTLAQGVVEMRKLLLPMIPRILPLMNTKLGFKTDRPTKNNPALYSNEVVCDCIIEAVIRGLRPIGNEFNIISGQCYTTKEGYTRLLREYPGLTNLRINNEVPIMREGGAIVTYKCSWKLAGIPDSLERSIAVRKDQFSGADQIIGKADRKIRAAIYAQITGSAHDEDDVEIGQEPPKLVGRTEQVMNKLVAQANEQNKSSSNGNSERQPATEEQMRRLVHLRAVLEVDPETFAERCREMDANPERLSREQAQRLIDAYDEVLEPKEESAQ